MNNRQWSLVKWSSLSVSIGSVLIAVGLMWLNSKESVVVAPTKVGEQVEKPQAKVEKPLIVERKGERLIWRLQADSAKQQEQGMYLIEPRLELFTEVGEAVPIRGREAWFEPLRKNISFKGAVQIDFHEWRLNSEALRYESGRDEAVVPGKFELNKPGIKLKGRGLRVDRKSQKLTVDHDVWLVDKSGVLGAKQ